MRGMATLLAAGLAALLPTLATAAEVSVAVAANFTRPAEELAEAFTAITGNTVTLSAGATGQLYAQITQGAPFEVFLSADSRRPDQAVSEGLGIEGTVFTYAIGRVVLYSPTTDVTDGKAVLEANAFQHLAVADPETAPYGAAGMQVLGKLGLTEAVRNKIVVGQNITQTLQFVDSGNAEVGFVALSQVVDMPASQVWRVPAEDYSPILQDAVLLKAGEEDPAARAFLDFLKSDEARAIIEKYGYEAGSNGRPGG